MDRRRHHHHHHFLVLCLPAQGHINPTLQLAKNLARAGARVTFATTVYGLHRMNNRPSQEGLHYASFSDGNDDPASRSKRSFSDYLSDLTRLGSESLEALLQKFSDESHPVTRVIYTIMLPWAATVARKMHVPSAFLFIQCATAFAVFRHFFSSQEGLCYSNATNINPSFSIKLPDLPSFPYNDIPTFLLPKDQFNSTVAPTFQEHLKVLEQEPNHKPCVIINTFFALEKEAFKSINQFMNIIPIGPLIPSSFSNGDYPTDNSFGCDLFESNTEYIKWLDSKEDNSVIYVSFGSLAELKKEQKEEIFDGLVNSGRPFVWVIRAPKNGEEEKDPITENGISRNGLIVEWCVQLEVLFHKSVGCFVTHCGWNSTLESIVAGVPVVGCPQFSDQPTNAKMVEEVWRNGVRARGDDGGVVKREELQRCLEKVMGGGEEGEEMRNNALKWRGLALEALKEGGSSFNNLKMFLEIVE